MLCSNRYVKVDICGDNVWRVFTKYIKITVWGTGADGGGGRGVLVGGNIPAQHPGGLSLFSSQSQT